MSANTFRRDGHVIALALDPTREITLRMVCPHEGQLLPKYKDTPECRRLYLRDENGLTFTTRPTCVVQANFRPEAYPLHFVHGETDFDRSFEIRQVPLAVGWAMVDEVVMTSLLLDPYHHHRGQQASADQGAHLRVHGAEVHA